MWAWWHSSFLPKTWLLWFTGSIFISMSNQLVDLSDGVCVLCVFVWEIQQRISKINTAHHITSKESTVYFSWIKHMFDIYSSVQRKCVCVCKLCVCGFQCSQVEHSPGASLVCSFSDLAGWRSYSGNTGRSTERGNSPLEESWRSKCSHLLWLLVPAWCSKALRSSVLVLDLAFGCENWLEAVPGTESFLVNRGLWSGGGVGPTSRIQLVVGNGASVLVRSVGGEVLCSHTGGVLKRQETHRKTGSRDRKRETKKA